MPTDAILTFSDYVVGEAGQPGLELELPEYSRHYVGYLEHWYQRTRNQDLPVIDPTNLGEAVLEVNAGRWVWQCPGCHNGELVQNEALIICYQCATGSWLVPRWPDNREEIEAELLRQPGYRLSAPIRNWEPGWTMDYLRERTAKAWLLVHQGVKLVRALSIGATRVWVDGEVLPAAQMNLYISDLIDDLAGRNGEQELEDSLRILDGTGSRFFGLPGGTTGQRPTNPRPGLVRFSKTNNRVEFHDGTNWQTFLDTSLLTYAWLNSRGLVGTGATQFAQGSHGH